MDVESYDIIDLASLKKVIDSLVESGVNPPVFRVTDLGVEETLTLVEVKTVLVEELENEKTKEVVKGIIIC